MKSFEQWFLETAKPTEELKEPPIGVTDNEDGSYSVQCCVCNKWDELPVDVDEINDDYEHYCGGSPRCCP